MSWFLRSSILNNLQFVLDPDEGDKIYCPVRKSLFFAKKEEIVRQAFLIYLSTQLQYPLSQIVVESPLMVGSQKVRIDIGILDQYQDFNTIVEVKARFNSDSLLQLKSYLFASSAKQGVLVDQSRYVVFVKRENKLIEIQRLPKYLEILSEEFFLQSSNQEYSDIPKEEMATKAIQNSTIEVAEAVIPKLKVNDETFPLLGITEFVRVSAKKTRVIIHEKPYLVENKTLLSPIRFRRFMLELGRDIGIYNRNEWEDAIANKLAIAKYEEIKVVYSLSQNSVASIDQDMAASIKAVLETYGKNEIFSEDLLKLVFPNRNGAFKKADYMNLSICMKEFGWHRKKLFTDKRRKWGYYK